MCSAYKEEWREKRRDRGRKLDICENVRTIDY